MATARALLAALRAAGCECYLDSDGDVIVSPPSRAVEWPIDPETAIEECHHALRECLELELIVAEFARALREPTSGADGGQ